MYDCTVFTGIIEAQAAVVQKTDRQLAVERPPSFMDIAIGSSIAVSGVCLSVIQFGDTTMAFDVVPETWSRTKLGSLQAGDRVNLERAMPANGRFEGHIVQGHVEGTAEVIALSDTHVLTLRLPSELILYVVPKGSIAIDGVSLTVATVDGDQCAIALIPHTLKQTTLGNLHIGDTVNVETDILGRYASL